MCQFELDEGESRKTCRHLSRSTKLIRRLIQWAGFVTGRRSAAVLTNQSTALSGLETNLRRPAPVIEHSHENRRAYCNWLRSKPSKQAESDKTMCQH